jgi:hypothetical protein
MIRNWFANRNKITDLSGDRACSPAVMEDACDWADCALRVLLPLVLDQNGFPEFADGLRHAPAISVRRLHKALERIRPLTDQIIEACQQRIDTLTLAEVEADWGRLDDLVANPVLFHDRTGEKFDDVFERVRQQVAWEQAKQGLGFPESWPALGGTIGREDQLDEVNRLALRIRPTVTADNPAVAARIKDHVVSRWRDQLDGRAKSDERMAAARARIDVVYRVVLVVGNGDHICVVLDRDTSDDDVANIRRWTKEIASSVVHQGAHWDTTYEHLATFIANGWGGTFTALLDTIQAIHQDAA